MEAFNGASRNTCSLFEFERGSDRDNRLEHEGSLMHPGRTGRRVTRYTPKAAIKICAAMRVYCRPSFQADMAKPASKGPALRRRLA